MKGRVKFVGVGTMHGKGFKREFGIEREVGFLLIKLG